MELQTFQKFTHLLHYTPYITTQHVSIVLEDKLYD